MNMRLFPILGITGLFSIALAGSAVAGGGGWPPAPGSYKMTDTSATAELVGATTIVCYPPKGCFPEPSEFAYVSVDRGLHISDAGHVELCVVRPEPDQDRRVVIGKLGLQHRDRMPRARVREEPRYPAACPHPPFSSREDS